MSPGVGCDSTAQGNKVTYTGVDPGFKKGPPNIIFDVAM